MDIHVLNYCSMSLQDFSTHIVKGEAQQNIPILGTVGRGGDVSFKVLLL